MHVRSLITTMLAFGLIMPSATYAISLDEIIENAKAGGGIYTESDSSVSTGGQTAGSGQSVTTDDASVSSHIETRINADNSGGKVEVKIETSKNGETKTEEYSQPIEKGEGVKVEVNASSKNGESKTEVKIDGEKVAPEAAQESKALSPRVAAVFSSKISLLFSEKIPSFFKKFLNIFAWL